MSAVPAVPTPYPSAGWRVSSFEVAMAIVAVVAAVAAVWVTLSADFLKYPGWLAAQKADFVLGPVFTGLYWRRRRPRSRFGALLIAFGFVGAVYVLQSSSAPWLFSVGLLWENVVGLAAYVLILAFPSGRLDRPARLVLLVAVLVAIVPAVVILLLLPQVGAGGSISACRALCPENKLAVTSDPGLALDLFDWFRYGVIVAALSVGGLLVWRILKGTPPQRRALAIGTPIALLFLVFQIAYQVLGIAGSSGTGLASVVIWGIVAARAALWYGFLFALISAQLFAARAIEHLVGRSLRRPSADDLEAMLREPLGDPELQLVFTDPRTGAWADPRFEREPQADRPGRDVTLVGQPGTTAVAIVHDAQLNDDPELLEAGGAVALLAAENAELDAKWADALAELQLSRTRLAHTADEERRRLERDLHDSVQERLIAVQIRLGMAAENPTLDHAARRNLTEAIDGMEAAFDAVREVAHGLYPPVLTDYGLVAALQEVRRRAATPLSIEATGVDRCPPDVESAVYYCCVEAIQNAIKHGGAGVQISVRLRGSDELVFEVADDGPGFRPDAVAGAGLNSMRDRLEALGGRLSVTTTPGGGTTVSGRVRLTDT